MKTGIVLSLLISAFSYAATEAVFSEDGKSVIIHIHGEDNDAKNLYSSLKIKAIEGETHWVKSREIVSTYGWDLLFKIDCLKAKNKSVESSCFIQMELGNQGVGIYPELKKAQVVPYGRSDSRLSRSIFSKKRRSHIYFESSDKTLKISDEVDPRTGSVYRFRLDYRDL